MLFLNKILKITKYGQGDGEKVSKMFDKLEKKTTEPRPTPRRVIDSKTVTFKNSPIVKTIFTQVMTPHCISKSGLRQIIKIFLLK